MKANTAVWIVGKECLRFRSYFCAQRLLCGSWCPNFLHHLGRVDDWRHTPLSSSLYLWEADAITFHNVSMENVVVLISVIKALNIVENANGARQDCLRRFLLFNLLNQGLKPRRTSLKPYQ